MLGGKSNGRRVPCARLGPAAHGVEDLPYAERATVPFPKGDPEWDETVATPGEAIDFLAGKGPGDYPDHNTMLAYRARFAMMKLTGRYTVEQRDSEARTVPERQA